MEHTHTPTHTHMNKCISICFFSYVCARVFRIKKHCIYLLYISIDIYCINIGCVLRTGLRIQIPPEVSVEFPPRVEGGELAWLVLYLGAISFSTREVAGAPEYVTNGLTSSDRTLWRSLSKLCFFPPRALPRLDASPRTARQKKVHSLA